MIIFVPLYQARKKELTGKVNQAERVVDSLQKEALGNLQNRMSEVCTSYFFTDARVYICKKKTD